MQDPLGPIEIVATNAMYTDPAIDTDAPDAEERLEKYRATRELADLPVRAGVEPAVFVGKPLPAVMAISALAPMAPAVRHMYAFLAGCHLVRLPGGVELKPRKVRPAASGTQMADDDWVNQITRQFGSDTIDEVGRVIYERARLPEGKKAFFR